MIGQIVGIFDSDLLLSYMYQLYKSAPKELTVSPCDELCLLMIEMLHLGFGIPKWRRLTILNSRRHSAVGRRRKHIFTTQLNSTAGWIELSGVASCRYDLHWALV
jgi:hypothetical protein